MDTTRRIIALAAVGCLTGALAAPAVADEADVPAPPNRVAISAASVAGSKATVTGTAAFDPITTPQNVGGTLTPGTVAGTAAGEAAGINLTKAEIVPLPNDAGLRFIWHLNSMPAEVPPEGVRYLWAFGIAGTNPLVTVQLQAKRTNVASVTTTEDPQGHALHAAKNEGWFQLRGSCTSNYAHPSNPVAGCYHLGFLKGAFDVANKTVTMDLPYQPRDGIGRLVVPDFKRGVTLEPFLSAGSSIAGSFQAVVSNALVSNAINGWNPYYAGGRVELGIGSPESFPEEIEYTSVATLAEDGTFSGTVEGVNPVDNTVFARACNGVECAYASFRAL